jgi:hypothetical protein
MYEITFHYVYDDLYEPISGLYVVEIKVHKPDGELYFLDGKHCYIKTDAGRKELSGLELVSEIKKRHQLQDNHLVQLDIVDFLELIAAIKPALYWSHSHVPYGHAEEYFATLQSIIHGKGVLFSNTSGHLISGTEHILRILKNLTKTEYNNGLGYENEKIRVVFNDFSNYFKNMDFNDDIVINNVVMGGISNYKHIVSSMNLLDIRNFFNTLKKGLERLISSSTLPKNETDFIKFTILILHYAVSNYEAFQRNQKHSDIPQHITNSFIDLIEPYFKSIGVSFLGSTSPYLSDLKNCCDSEWSKST